MITYRQRPDKLEEKISDLRGLFAQKEPACVRPELYYTEYELTGITTYISESFLTMTVKKYSICLNEKAHYGRSGST